MNDTNILSDHFAKKQRAPFLFLGSGFTKHYLNTPKWDEILAAVAPKHINAYFSVLGNTNLPAVASAIAKDLTTAFWQKPDDDPLKIDLQEKITTPSSVLKYMIADRFKGCTISSIPEAYSDEIKLLQSLVIDGIITTNWDDFANSIFYSFKSYTGQKELIFSPTFNIGEVYQIHGSIFQPESMVITQEDYDDFNGKNAYLAAKLTTIFIEHPIIFIGYSLQDPNIQQILEGVVACLDSSNMRKLQENLYFVEWIPEEIKGIETSTIEIKMGNNSMLPVTLIRCHDYAPVYECLSKFQRNIPTSVLRYYKQCFYDIVVSENPEKKLYAINEKYLDNSTDVEFVLGYGAVSQYRNAVGYVGLKPISIYKDILFDDEKFIPEQILTKALPEMRKNGPKYLPCYKYLRQIGITSNQAFKGNSLGVEWQLLNVQQIKVPYGPSIEQVIKEKTVQQVIDENIPDKAITAIPHMAISEEDIAIIQQFCQKHLNEYLVLRNKYATNFRRLVCFYDLIKYGWQDTV